MADQSECSLGYFLFEKICVLKCCVIDFILCVQPSVVAEACCLWVGSVWLYSHYVLSLAWRLSVNVSCIFLFHIRLRWLCLRVWLLCRVL